MNYTERDFERAAKVVVGRMTATVTAHRFAGDMMTELSVPYLDRLRVGTEIWKWMKTTGSLSALGVSVNTFRSGGIFSQGVTKQNPSTNAPLVNNATCPHCKNERCNRTEKLCWKCGGELPLQ